MRKLISKVKIHISNKKSSQSSIWYILKDQDQAKRMLAPFFHVCTCSSPFSHTGALCDHEFLHVFEQPHKQHYLCHISQCVMDPSMTLAHKVGPGLQDLQKQGRRILAEGNAKKAEENTWIGRMVAAESIGDLNGLIKSCAA